MNPNDLIDTIVDAIDYAEIAKDSQGLIKARRLLNNDLRQAIDLYIHEEVSKALNGADSKPAVPPAQEPRKKRYFPLPKVQQIAANRWR